jgi:hypothetical protein
MRVELDFGFVVVRVPDNALAAHLAGCGHETTVREAKRQLAEVAEWVEALRSSNDNSGTGRAARDERLTGEQFGKWEVSTAGDDRARAGPQISSAARRAARGSDMITDEKLKRWRELTDAATPGPWVVIPDIRPDLVTEIWTQSGRGGYADEGEIIREIHKHEGHIAELAKKYIEDGKIGSASDDAEFLAAAREAMPALLDEVVRLRVRVGPDEEGDEMTLVQYAKYPEDDLDVTERDILTEARAMWTDKSVPLWSVAAALQLGYVGEGVVIHVARTISKWYFIYNPWWAKQK